MSRSDMVATYQYFKMLYPLIETLIWALLGSGEFCDWLIDAGARSARASVIGSVC
jgi:hypothetical protein